MRNYKAQLKSWYPNGQFNADKFEYDALNGDIDVLNAQQIQQKALKVRQNTTKRGTKMRMSRLINAANHNSHMHRIANVWNMGQASDYSNNDNPVETGKTALNHINTKAKMENDAENKLIMLAQKGKLINKFAKGWNKYNPEKIVNPKQDGFNLKSKIFALDKYPKVKSNNFEKFLNHNKYYNGLRETVAYTNDNHMNDKHTNKLLYNLNVGMRKINNDMKYTALSKRLQSAYRYTSTIKRHRIKGLKHIINMDKSTHDFQDVPKNNKQLNHIKKMHRSKLLEDAYAYKYGIGNDQIDIDPTESVVTPEEDGRKSFKKAITFIHHIDNQSKTAHTNSLLKSVGLSNPSNLNSKNKHHDFSKAHKSLHVKSHQHNIQPTVHGRTRKISRNDFHI